MSLALPRPRLGAALEVIRATIAECRRDRASLLAAAVALYGILSLAPLGLLVALFAVPVLGVETTRRQLLDQLGSAVGPSAARAVDQVLDGLLAAQIGPELGILSAAVVAYAAIRLFGTLQTALNVSWNLRVKPFRQMGSARPYFLFRRLLSFVTISLLGLLLLVSIALNAALSAIEHLVPPGFVSTWTLRLADIGIAFVLGALAFALIFKIVPDARVRWSDVWLGAAATSAGFLVGRLALGWYFGQRPLAPGEVAGALVVLMLWAQYSAQVMVVGAELTQVLAFRRGGIRPYAYSELADSATPPSLKA